MSYLDWKPRASDYWVVDTEADGLTPTRLWCAVAKNLGTEEVVEFTPDDMTHGGKFSVFIRSVPRVVGHNFLSFDRRVVDRLIGATVPVSKVVDTLVLSYLYHPHLPDGHSLAAYGERFGVAKLEHRRLEPVLSGDDGPVSS